MFRCSWWSLRLDLVKNPVDGFSVGLIDDANIFKWQVMIEGPTGTMLYVSSVVVVVEVTFHSNDYDVSEGGLFPAELTFPDDYPNRPPTMRFTIPDFWHPNGMILFHRHCRFINTHCT